MYPGVDAKSRGSGYMVVIMTTTLQKKDGVLPWLIMTGMPSVKPKTKASKEMIGKKCMSLTKK